MKGRFTEAFNVPVVEVDTPDDMWADPKQYASVEFELEKVQDFRIDHASWEVGEDHSLRNGLEWKLRRPLMGKRLAVAINTFFDALDAVPKNDRPVVSYRTGLHVHLNFSRSESDNASQLRTMVASYFLVEGLMFAFAGVDRKWCGYCWSMADANGLLHKVLDPELPERQLEIAVRDSSRYLGLNLQSLSKYGSLEFRHMEMTLDRARVINWMNSIMNLRLYAASYDSSDERAFEKVLDSYQRLGPTAFVRAVFKDRAEDFMPYLDVRDMDERADHLKLCFARQSEASINAGRSRSLANNPLFKKAFKDIKIKEADKYRTFLDLNSDLDANPINGAEDAQARMRECEMLYIDAARNDNNAMNELDEMLGKLRIAAQAFVPKRRREYPPPVMTRASAGNPFILATPDRNPPQAEDYFRDVEDAPDVPQPRINIVQNTLQFGVRR